MFIPVQVAALLFPTNHIFLEKVFLKLPKLSGSIRKKVVHLYRKHASYLPKRLGASGKKRFYIYRGSMLPRESNTRKKDEGAERADSTVAPPHPPSPPPVPPSVFLQKNIPWLLDTRKGAVENIRIRMFSCLQSKAHRTMMSGWPGARCFRRCSRELVSKPAIFRRTKVGGGLP